MTQQNFELLYELILHSMDESLMDMKDRFEKIRPHGLHEEDAEILEIINLYLKTDFDELIEKEAKESEKEGMQDIEVILIPFKIEAEINVRTKIVKEEGYHAGIATEVEILDKTIYLLKEFNNDDCTALGLAAQTAGLFKGGLMYHCHHIPTNENWCIIGISTDLKKVCAAGWPPSIADMKDCDDWELHGKLTEKELEYREKEFGGGWL